MANTANLAIFFGGAAVLGYVVWSQMVTPLEKKIAGSIAAIKAKKEFIMVGEGLKRKVSALKAENESTATVLTGLLKLFPDAEIDTSKLTGILDGAPRELPGISILKAPPLRKDALAWQPRTTTTEDLTNLYKSLVGDDMQTLEGAKLEGTLKLARMDQDWDLEADWESFPDLLVKVSQLSYYFEVTKLDVWGVVDPTFKKEYRPPKTGPKTLPRKVKVSMQLTTVAMPPLPGAPAKQ